VRTGCDHLRSVATHDYAARREELSGDGSSAGVATGAGTGRLRPAASAHAAQHDDAVRSLKGEDGRRNGVLANFTEPEFCECAFLEHVDMSLDPAPKLIGNSKDRCPPTL
jgi:hypothetical protein